MSVIHRQAAGYSHMGLIRQTSFDQSGKASFERRSIS